MPQQPIIALFGSSRPQPGEPEYEVAFETGKQLAAAGFIICNGGYGGTMEASAKGAKSAGGRTLGVVSTFFGREANRWIDTVITTDTLVERLMRLITLGDGYVVFKGGTGTLLELAAVWELMNKSVITEKPIVVVGEFWNGVVHTLKEELAWEGRRDCTRFVTVVPSPEECAAFLRRWFEERTKGRS